MRPQCMCVRMRTPLVQPCSRLQVKLALMALTSLSPFKLASAPPLSAPPTRYSCHNILTPANDPQGSTFDARGLGNETKSAQAPPFPFAPAVPRKYARSGCCSRALPLRCGDHQDDVSMTACCMQTSDPQSPRKAESGLGDGLMSAAGQMPTCLHLQRRAPCTSCMAAKREAGGQCVVPSLCAFTAVCSIWHHAENTLVLVARF